MSMANAAVHHPLRRYVYRTYSNKTVTFGCPKRLWPECGLTVFNCVTATCLCTSDEA